jgi:hypothetical protein
VVSAERGAATLQFDPVIVRLLADHEARVPAAMLSGAIGTAVVHPLVADVDDDSLRAQLLQLTRRLLAMPE